MADSDPQESDPALAEIERQLADIVPPADTPANADIRVIRRKLTQGYCEKLTADKEVESAERRRAAQEAEFKRYERRYGWTRAYYVWFCNRPRDEQTAILARERQELRRRKKRGGKDARSYQRRTPEEQAERKRKRDRERYHRKKAEKEAQEQAEIAARAIV